MVSNINFFMNVPVEADGTLGIVDGISAPGLYVDLRAEMDVIVVVSNCPQINNPCNGFNPDARAHDHRRADLMFDKVLIANRGAIACRIIRTLRRMGVGSVAVFSDADAGSLHVAQADEAVRIGPAPAAESYLDVEAILAAARRHRRRRRSIPGYGFLCENAAFAERCAQAGIAFIGPTPDNIRAFGLKHTARELARQARACRWRPAPICSATSMPPCWRPTGSAIR